MIEFPWVGHFSLNSDVNWQAKTFMEIFLNVMSNFVPNEVKRISLRVFFPGIVIKLQDWRGSDIN